MTEMTIVDEVCVVDYILRKEDVVTPISEIA
jgi:hypothetical protein